MSRIGVAFVGLGLAVKPHAMAIRDLADRVDFVGGFSPSAARRAEFTKTYALPTAESYDSLLTNPRVNVVFVMTPPRTHGELAIAAARAGKHVLLEKPIDVTAEAARQVVDAVASTGQKLAVMFQFRFRPGALALRQLVRDGALGEILSASASVRWWRGPDYYGQPGRGMLARDGGGVLLTQAIHTLDLLLDLAGPVVKVSAACRTSTLRTIDTEDIACATLHFRNGAVGVVDATTAAYPGYPERIEIAGTRGSALLESERLVFHRVGEEPLEISGSLQSGGGADPMAFSHEPHRRLIEDFLDSIEHNREPVTNGTSALRVHGLIDAMLASSKSGGPVVLAF